MYSNSTVNTGALTGALLVSSIFGLLVLVFFIIIYWRIFSKAGYSGALSLLLFIPIANIIVFIIVLCVLAFGNWPIYKELNYLRQQVAQGQRNPVSPQAFPQAAPGGFPQQYPSSPQYPPYNQPQQYNQPQPPQNR